MGKMKYDMPKLMIIIVITIFILRDKQHIIHAKKIMLMILNQIVWKNSQNTSHTVNGLAFCETSGNDCGKIVAASISTCTFVLSNSRFFSKSLFLFNENNCVIQRLFEDW